MGILSQSTGVLFVHLALHLQLLQLVSTQYLSNTQAQVSLAEKVPRQFSFELTDHEHVLNGPKTGER